jgi:hypothetical protein
MKSARFAILWTACLLACPSGEAAAAPRAFQLSDLQKIVSLGDPHIPPDVKNIAVIVSTPDWATYKPKK